MQLSAVIDTVIGVSFTFFLLSTACSAVCEGIAALLQKRSKYLLRGLAELLGGAALDPAAGSAGSAGLVARVRRWRPAAAAERQLRGRVLTAVASAPASRADARQRYGAAESRADLVGVLFSHPLLATQIQRKPTGKPTRVPSYLSSRTVAVALLDQLFPATPRGRTDVVTDVVGPGDVGSVNAHLGDALSALARVAGDDEARLLAEVERWYDDQMERVSGMYKRWVKRWLLVVALGFVLALHVDAIALTSTLWNSPGIRSAVVAQASPTVCDAAAAGATTEQRLTCLRDAGVRLSAIDVPIGPPAGCRWSSAERCLFPESSPESRATVISGLLLSVLAAGFGAPFWFDALTRLGSLRSSGTRPASAARPSA